MLFFNASPKLSNEEEQFFRKAEPLVLMGRGHSGTRVFALFCEKLGYNLDADNKMSTGDASDTWFTNRVKKIALKYLKSGISESLINYFKYITLRYYRRLEGDKLQWGWKFPETYLIGPIVDAAFPNAKYLHLVRDGRDIAFKRHQTDRIDRPLGHEIINKMKVMGQPHHVQAAASWKYQVDSFDYWKQQLNEGQIHEVQFESFVQNPLTEGQKISTFLNQPFSRELKDFLETTVNQKKVSQFELENGEKVLEVEKLIGDTLKRWHYI